MRWKVENFAPDIAKVEGMELTKVAQCGNCLMAVFDFETRMNSKEPALGATPFHKGLNP